MPVTAPFYRTCRPFASGRYIDGEKWKYILDPRFARDALQFIRAFQLIQKDLLTLFDYIEPADTNKECYSYRTYELLLRTCVEIEANLTAILRENGYGHADNWTMSDYRKINRTHRLSSYQIRLPAWRGEGGLFKPFEAWATGGSLSWYQSYNATKHDRHGEFRKANFEALVGAIAGLAALLSAQFHCQDFDTNTYVVANEPSGGFETAIGDYFLVKHPTDWPEVDRYDFDWGELKGNPEPFQKLRI